MSKKEAATELEAIPRAFNGCLSDAATCQYIASAVVEGPDGRPSWNVSRPAVAEELLGMGRLKRFESRAAVAYTAHLLGDSWGQIGGFSYADPLCPLERFTTNSNRLLAMEALVRGLVLTPNAKTEQMAQARFAIGMLNNSLKRRNELWVYDRESVASMDLSDFYFPGLGGDLAHLVREILDGDGRELLKAYREFGSRVTDDVSEIIPTSPDSKKIDVGLVRHTLLWRVLDKIYLVYSVAQAVSRGELIGPIEPPGSERVISDVSFYDLDSRLVYLTAGDAIGYLVAKAVAATFTKNDPGQIDLKRKDAYLEQDYGGLTLKIARRHFEGEELDHLLVTIMKKKVGDRGTGFAITSSSTTN